MIGNSAVRADLTSNRGLREAITGRSAASWTDWRNEQADRQQNQPPKPESKPRIASAKGRGKGGSRRSPEANEPPHHGQDQDWVFPVHGASGPVPRRRPGKGGRCSLLALSINRYICIYSYYHRASSSAAKRLACQVAKALIEALEAGSPFPLRRHHGKGYSGRYTITDTVIARSGRAACGFLGRGREGPHLGTDQGRTERGKGQGQTAWAVPQVERRRQT